MIYFVLNLVMALYLSNCEMNGHKGTTCGQLSFAVKDLRDLVLKFDNQWFKFKELT